MYMYVKYFEAKVLIS